MPSPASIRLREADPNLGRFLARADWEQAGELRLPLLELEPGALDITRTLVASRAFAGLVLDGMLLQSLQLGEHAGLRLLEPGDLVALNDLPSPTLAVEAGVRATVVTHLALLGQEFLLAVRRWPWLAAGLTAQAAEQAERLTTQLMICQLPRVDERLLAIMWMMAESRGRVTPSGTVLGIQLTHSALGGLIGARRPTVTLALRELTESGAVVRQADGWLLLKPPAVPRSAAPEPVGEPRPLEPARELWTFPNGNLRAARVQANSAAHQELSRTVARLRAEHRDAIQRTQERLAQIAASRERVTTVRSRISRQAQVRRRPPSS